MNLIDYWRILVRYKVLIALSTIVAIAAGVAVIIRSPSVYEARCKMLIVNANKTDAVFDPSDLTLGTLGKSDPLATQMEFIKTRPVFLEVIKRCGLKDKNDLSVTVNSLAKNTSIAAIKSSNILQLMYRDPDPAVAVRVLSAIAQVAEEQNENLNRQEIRNMREFIEMQLDAQKGKLEKAEQATVNFKNKENAVSIDLQTKSQIDAAAEIKAGIVKLESQRQGVLAQKSQIESNLSMPGAQADPFYASRLNMLEQMNNQLSNIEAQKRAMYSHLGLINKNLSTLPQEEVNLYRRQRDEKVTGTLYTDLLSKYNELEIKEAAKTASIKIIEPAFATEHPVFPEKRKTVLLSMLFGLFFGCGIAFLKEFLNDSPRSLEDLKRALPYRALGAVPVVKNEDLLFMHTDPYSKASENMRLVRANLAFNPGYDEKNLSLLITSALPQEGKALLSTNISLMYSAMGKKTVLVNFDLRRPLMGRMFDFQSGKG